MLLNYLITKAIVNDNEKHIKKIELINKIIDYWGIDASGDLTEITKEMYETFLQVFLLCPKRAKDIKLCKIIKSDMTINKKEKLWQMKLL